jgi:hypothetical protein
MMISPRSSSRLAWSDSVEGRIFVRKKVGPISGCAFGGVQYSRRGRRV